MAQLKEACVFDRCPFRRCFHWFGFNVLLMVTVASHAQAIHWQGEWVQGGVLRGSVSESTHIILQVGRETITVPLSEAGHFVIGLDRDAPSTVSVTVGQKKHQIKQMFEVKQRTYLEQRIDGLPPSKVNVATRYLERIRSESADIRKARSQRLNRNDFSVDFMWPVKGPITGVYGSKRVLNGMPRRPHYGIDIAAPTGTPVKAPAGGVVTYADDMFFSGKTMVIDHGHGLSSTFLHLHKMLLPVGTEVNQGEVFATVGATGRVTGAHLDWRANWFQFRVDPMYLLTESERR